MSKINLDFSTARAMGKYLPSVMINSIAIENRGSEAALEPTATGSTTGEAGDIIITANLIINITKPKDMIDPAAWIREYLGDLYLYAYVSSFEALNTQLEEKKFFLKDLQYALKNTDREWFSSSSPGFSVIHEYMKEAFVTHEWLDWLGEPGSVIRDAYSAASTSEISAGLGDPECIWHYLFYGNWGTSGPWWGTDGWYAPETGNHGDLDSSKELFTDIFHDTKSTWDFEAAAIEHSFMKGFIDNYLYFLSGVPGWGTDSDWFGVNLTARKIPLRDLLTDETAGEYGSNFFIQNVYDQEGNELIQISNINVRFEYGIKYSVEEDHEGETYDYSTVLQRLKDTDKLFFIGTIGVDTDAFDSSNDTPRSIYNSFFGNISYEHILQNNNVPTQYVETFHISNTGAPYDEIPIVNLDGRYHIVEPVGPEVIADRIRSLMGTYEHRKKDQYSLSRNLDTLESILQTYEKSPSILRMLAGFQQSYSPKVESTPSGWFYNDFTTLLSALSKQVGYQARLDKRLSRVGIVTDYRAMAINEVYFPPTPKWNSDGGLLFDNGTDGAGSDDFIPSKWSRMSRMTLLGDVIPGDDLAGFGSDNEQFRQDLWRDLEDSGKIADWLEMGFTMIDINAWVEAATGQMALREGSQGPGGSWIEGDMGSAGLDDMHDPWGLQRLKDYDFVVKNSGHFWFDWEKALNTQSNIAQILQLNKLGRYFRMQVPYQYFPVTQCTLSRTELDLALGLDADLGESEWLSNQHTMTMTTSLQGALPGSTNQTLTYEITPAEPEDYAYGFPYKQCSSLRTRWSEEAGATSVDIYSKSKSGEGALQDEDHLEGDYIKLTETMEKSYLKFVMADSAISSAAKFNRADGDTVYSHSQDSLLAYGYAPPGIPLEVDGSMTYSAVPVDNALSAGFRIRNGYRLMAFEYADLMDDDVAFYNTMVTTEDRFPNRQRALETFNSIGQSNSEYKVKIKVQDNSLAFYTDVFWPFLMEAYEHFHEYYLFAEEFCSFNNLNNQFNKFFVDAINERYAGSSEKRWVRAALLVVLLKEILYRSAEYSGAGTEEELRTMMETEVLEIINNISPEEGNLQALRMFNCRFGSYLHEVNPYGSTFNVFCTDSAEPQVYTRALEISGIADAELSDDESDWDRLRDTTIEHEFTNYLQIDSVIYGDYMLNAQLDDDISFGATGLHPLGVPPMHVYLTSGRPISPQGGYTDKSRILVYAHGMPVAARTSHWTDCSMPSSIMYDGSEGAYAGQSGWFYLDNLIDRGDKAGMDHGDFIMPSGALGIRTPLLLDFGKASVTGPDAEMFDFSDSAGLEAFSIDSMLRHAGTTEFSMEMFEFVCGVGTEHHSGTGDEPSWAESVSSFADTEYGRFTVVMLDHETISEWSTVGDGPGEGGYGTGWRIMDPTRAAKHLYVNFERLERLVAQSITISLTELLMGDVSRETGVMEGGFDAGETGYITESHLHGNIGGFIVDSLAITGEETETLWFPNWVNMDPTAPSGGAWTDVKPCVVSDWRTYRPAFGSYDEYDDADAATDAEGTPIEPDAPKDEG